MNVSAAIADPLLLRVKRERDKKDVRERRDSKFGVRGSEYFSLQTVSLVALFPPVSLSNRFILTTDTRKNSQKAVVGLPQR